jgi:hypothetical protein
LEGIAQKCLEEKNSHGYSSQNSFVGNVLSMGLQPSYLWFQASKASLFSLKGFEHQMGNFSYPVKTELSAFCVFNSFLG